MAPVNLQAWGVLRLLDGVESTSRLARAHDLITCAAMMVR